MFTVKHVEQSGYESIVLAETVSFYANGYSDAATSDQVVNTRGRVYQQPMVRAFGVVGSVCKDEGSNKGANTYGGGVIYVMNDQGATVSKYDLDQIMRDQAREEERRNSPKSSAVGA